MNWSDILAAIEVLPNWVLRIILAAAVTVLGYFAIRIIERLVDGAMYRSDKFDPTLRNFLDSVTNVVGWVVLTIIVLNVFGISIAALLGGLTIGGLVLGFALKDTLGNLAAGVMLLATRPFKVGDTITAGGESGDVTDLGISLTTLMAADGRIITIPNGQLMTAAITNHTRHRERRADVAVSIGYKDNIDDAVRAIMAAVKTDPRVLDMPATTVRIGALGADGVDLVVRPWVATGDYWAAKADLHGTVRDALLGAGFDIPYPQRVVHQA